MRVCDPRYESPHHTIVNRPILSRFLYTICGVLALPDCSRCRTIFSAGLAAPAELCSWNTPRCDRTFANTLIIVREVFFDELKDQIPPEVKIILVQAMRFFYSNLLKIYIAKI